MNVGGAVLAVFFWIPLRYGTGEHLYCPCNMKQLMWRRVGVFCNDNQQI
jgi:hypothetical protein